MLWKAIVLAAGFLLAGSFLSSPVVADGGVYFPDPALESAVRRYLEIAPPTAITAADMANLTALGARLYPIKDLTGLEYATNLECLYMNSTVVRDLSPIVGLTNLAVLNVDYTAVRDLSPIAGLTNMTTLSACQDGLGDMSAVYAMKNLETLRLNNNRISRVPDLSGFDNLIDIDLENNDISCISGLRGPTIRDNMFPICIMNLSNNQIDDVSPLADGNIMGLDLSGNQISDISPLVGLRDLCSLDLRRNPLNQAAYDIYLPLLQSRNPTADILYDPLPEPAMVVLFILGCQSIRLKRRP